MSSFQWNHELNVTLNAGNVIVGTISEIDYEALTATVFSEGKLVGKNIPIHYHCEEDNSDDGTSFGTSYPDGLDEFGADAFVDGDEVSVMFRDIKNTKPLIIGFPNSAPECLGCPLCEDFNKGENCTIEADGVYTFIFYKEGRRYHPDGCDEKPDLNNLSDGLSGIYSGEFSNRRYDEGSEKWLVDYTASTDICTYEDDEEINCPRICSTPFGCCFQIDEDSTPEEIAPTDGANPGHVKIYVRGGLASYTFSTETEGYYFNENLIDKTITTSKLYATLYCDGVGGSCGVEYDAVVDVTVTDACYKEEEDKVTAKLRNTGGAWAQVEWIQACVEGEEHCDNFDPCYFDNVDWPQLVIEDKMWSFRWRFAQCWYGDIITNFWVTSWDGCFPPFPPLADNPPPYDFQEIQAMLMPECLCGGNSGYCAMGTPAIYHEWRCP